LEVYNNIKDWVLTKEEIMDNTVYEIYRKLAIKKGLIKPIKKVALKPTGDLEQDVLLLCEGLRKNNKIKQAQEIERAFIEYKSAKSENQIGKIIDEVHPEGSVRVGDSELAVSHTVNDIHKQILNMLNK
jgi:hypothetical protein